jgi:hypothetical protein
MDEAVKLRAQARSKFQLAATARRLGPGLTPTKDRESIAKFAQELEDDGATLTAEANALDAKKPTST